MDHRSDCLLGAENIDCYRTQPLTAELLVKGVERELRSYPEHLVHAAQQEFRIDKVAINLIDDGVQELRLAAKVVRPSGHSFALVRDDFVCLTR